MATKGEKQEGINKELGINRYTHVCKTDKQQSPAV